MPGVKCRPYGSVDPTEGVNILQIGAQEPLERQRPYPQANERFKVRGGR